MLASLTACSIACSLICSLRCLFVCFICGLGCLTPRNGSSHCIGPKKQATLQMVDLGVCIGLFACSFVCLFICVFVVGLFRLLVCLFRPTRWQISRVCVSLAVCLFACLFLENCICVVAWLFVSFYNNHDLFEVDLQYLKK